MIPYLDIESPLVKLKKIFSTNEVFLVPHNLLLNMSSFTFQTDLF